MYMNVYTHLYCDTDALWDCVCLCLYGDRVEEGRTPNGNNETVKTEKGEWCRAKRRFISYSL